MRVNQSPLGNFGLLLEPKSIGEDLKVLPAVTLRELLAQNQLLLLRGFHLTEGAQALCDFAESIGEISEWPFGKVLELLEQRNPGDHIFHHSYVPLHWDGMYRPQVPGIQLFHCVESLDPHHGGCTTFSHTGLALELAGSDLVGKWQRITGRYERQMEFYRSKTKAPLIDRHPINGRAVIRYCEPPIAGDKGFINHPKISFKGIPESEVAFLHQQLKSILYHPSCYYRHRWRKGDVVLADNHTLLHGRESFKSGSGRHLRRIHILGDPPYVNPHLLEYA